MLMIILVSQTVVDTRVSRHNMSPGQTPETAVIVKFIVYKMGVLFFHQNHHYSRKTPTAGFRLPPNYATQNTNVLNKNVFFLLLVIFYLTNLVIARYNQHFPLFLATVIIIVLCPGASHPHHVPVRVFSAGRAAPQSEVVHRRLRVAALRHARPERHARALSRRTDTRYTPSLLF